MTIIGLILLLSLREDIGKQQKMVLFGENRVTLVLEDTIVDIVLSCLKENLLGHYYLWVQKEKLNYTQNTQKTLN